MVFVLVAAMGIITGRWLGWPIVVAVALVLAIAVGLEGAIESRTILKVMKRHLEINSTFQGTYLAALWAFHGAHFLRAEK